MDGRQGNAGGCHVRYRRRRRQHPCGGGSGSKPWTQTPCRRRRRQHPCDGGGSKPWTETPCRRVPWLWPWASGRKLRPQLGSTGASQRAPAAAALPPGHGGGGSKLGPKRRAAESRGCDRRPWAGNCGRSSAARGSVQIAKRAAAPNHASRPRTLLQDKKATIEGARRAGRPADERGRELQARIHAARRALSPAGTGLLLAADYPGGRADK